MDLVGGMDSQGGYVLEILYVKVKESGPLSGVCTGDAPSRSANDKVNKLCINADLLTCHAHIYTKIVICDLSIDITSMGNGGLEYFIVCLLSESN